jgi:membrane-associated HD superfamily phosphohydrolase
MAQDNNDQVDILKFTYPGPKPQSPETALLMLADGCEAKTKADNPSTTEEIDEIVRFIINCRLKQGQLDKSDLSLTDLGKVRDSFVTTLRGYYHSRLKYPSESIVEGPIVENFDESIETNHTSDSA